MDRLLGMLEQSLQQSVQGMVLLEHGEPRRDAIVRAFERAGYRHVQEPPEAETLGYRDAATPSLSLHFVVPRQGNYRPAVKRVHVWRADARTMGYTVVCAPLWLLQLTGVLIGLGSAVAAFMGDPMHRPWIVGLIAAGVLFGLPKLWIDDMRQLLRDALEDARAADAAPDAVTAPAKAKPRVEPVLEVTVRVAADDPEDLAHELEREARRGEPRGRD